MSASIKTGLVMVNTGPGKGKTTAALGAALRACGRGLRVVMLQFIKARESGEHLAARHIPGLTILPLGLGLIRGHPNPEDMARAGQAWSRAVAEATSGNWDLMIMDEICVALNYGLVVTEEVVTLIQTRPPSLHLILTGRDCPPEILAWADTVTIMDVAKHHFSSGMKARPGIEF